MDNKTENQGVENDAPATSGQNGVGMKKIEAIKKKMDKLNKEKPGTVELKPPVSMDKVKEFRQ